MGCKCEKKIQAKETFPTVGHDPVSNNWYKTKSSRSVLWAHHFYGPSTELSVDSQLFSAKDNYPPCQSAFTFIRSHGPDANRSRGSTKICLRHASVTTVTQQVIKIVFNERSIHSPLGLSSAARMTRRPMRPNPLIPRAVGMVEDE